MAHTSMVELLGVSLRTLMELYNAVSRVMEKRARNSDG